MEKIGKVRVLRAAHLHEPVGVGGGALCRDGRAELGAVFLDEAIGIGGIHHRHLSLLLQHQVGEFGAVLVPLGHAQLFQFDKQRLHLGRRSEHFLDAWLGL